MDTETAAKIEELRTLVDATISEWREWETSAQAIASVLDDVGGAIDAEDMPGAIDDVLSNVRMLDWSSPKNMTALTDEDMVRIENLLDEIHDDLAADDADEDEDELPPPAGADDEAESYLRGAIDAYRARNVGDAIEHAANAIRRMTRS